MKARAVDFANFCPCPQLGTQVPRMLNSINNNSTNCLLLLTPKQLIPQKFPQAMDYQAKCCIPASAAMSCSGSADSPLPHFPHCENHRELVCNANGARVAAFLLLWQPWL
mmetsp:Transcript_72735/g.140569  ORF Transcript_72735/g.140569 Transcript_72735/m.140569 type:complete len:110 (+) Transcript_72735:107-436(+)